MVGPLATQMRHLAPRPFSTHCRHQLPSYVLWMPVAKPQSARVDPAPLTSGEAKFITETVKRFFGDEAVVRSYGPDPARLAIHVETDRDPGMDKYDCLGVLMTRIERDQISLEVTKRGRRVRGDAKLAYRQGIVL
jgi:hypothetical protein